MNSYSIAAYEHQPIIDTYKQWLVNDLYQNFSFDNIEDTNFLQKLSIIQAEGIRHDIALHAAVTSDSISRASFNVGKRIQSAASLISSSLDDGFALMNNHMIGINNNLKDIGVGIGTVNQSLQDGNQILSNIGNIMNVASRGILQVNEGISLANQKIEQVNRGISALAVGMSQLNQNMITGLVALNSNISQSASIIQYQIQQTEIVLHQILDELKVPESQRERRYHIEEGMKYFNKGMSSGDCLYFDDALDEFNKAITIEKKDFFSWYYMGMIYLYSKEHIDPEKAISAFDHYIHYAEALPKRHYLLDEAFLMKAECKYLVYDVDNAYKLVESLIGVNDKAAWRAMKYLSSSPDSEKHKQAVNILDMLVQKNPYAIVQVLEDYDLISNEYIIEYIKLYKEKLIRNLPAVFKSVEDFADSIKKLSYRYSEILTQLSCLKNSVSLSSQDLGVIDLLKLNNEATMIRAEIENFKSAANDFHEGLAKFKNREGEWGFFDEIGRIIVSCQYRNVTDFHEGLASVMDQKNHCGYINPKGEVVIPIEYNSALPFRDGFAVVRKNEWYYNQYNPSNSKLTYYTGIIDKSNRVVVPLKWKDIRSVRRINDDVYVQVQNQNGGWGVVDIKGRIIVSCQWSDVWIDEYDFKRGVYKVKNSDGQWGAVDINGRIVIPFQYSSFSSFSTFIKR